MLEKVTFCGMMPCEDEFEFKNGINQIDTNEERSKIIMTFAFETSLLGE